MVLFQILLQNVLCKLQYRVHSKVQWSEMPQDNKNYLSFWAYCKSNNENQTLHCSRVIGTFGNTMKNRALKHLFFLHSCNIILLFFIPYTPIFRSTIEAFCNTVKSINLLMQYIRHYVKLHLIHKKNYKLTHSLILITF